MSDETKKNCNSCKFSRFERCETLKNNEEYQGLPNNILGMEKLEFKENFICDCYKSMYIEFPIEVSGINRDTGSFGLRARDAGKFVKIRPCSEEHSGKTFLGLYLGELPIDFSISHNPDSKELNVRFMTNPGIFVFDLNKIVYGCESFWAIVKSDDDLKEITQANIDNIWYVKALKALSSQCVFQILSEPTPPAAG